MSIYALASSYIKGNPTFGIIYSQEAKDAFRGTKIKGDVRVRNPTEMELLVAKAICKKHGIDWVTPTDIDAMKTCLDVAQTAIRAMREPTQKMIDASLIPGIGDSPEDVTAIWEEMIDAASPPDES